MHTFRLTSGPMAGEEFAFFAATAEEAHAGAAAWVASEPALAGATWEPLPALKVTLPEGPTRWQRCAAALGREPTGWEFVVWVGQRWCDFAALHGCKDSDAVRQRLGPEAIHQAFDAWLEEGVAAGQWKDAGTVLGSDVSP